MFVRDGKEINIYAPFETEEGDRYTNLTVAHDRERFGVVEVPDPTPPEEALAHPDWYHVNQTPDQLAPFRIWTRLPQETIDQIEQRKINQQALAYLASTDWYVTRFAETGVKVPEDVLTNRATARASVQALPEHP